MNNYNDVLVGFSELIKNEEFRPYEGALRLGVDLGTANIVVSVVDANNTPTKTNPCGVCCIRTFPAPSAS